VGLAKGLFAVGSHLHQHDALVPDVVVAVRCFLADVEIEVRAGLTALPLARLNYPLALLSPEQARRPSYALLASTGDWL
jgi:hypothetical protein